MRKKPVVRTRNGGAIGQAMRVFRQTLRSIILCTQENEEGLTGAVISPYLLSKYIDFSEKLEKNNLKPEKMDPLNPNPSVASTSSSAACSTSTGHCPSSVLNRAPSAASFEFFVADYMTHVENRTTIESQLKEIIVDKGRLMANMHPDEGRTLSEAVVMAMFQLCEKLNVTNIVKYHSLHLFDRLTLSERKKLGMYLPLPPQAGWEADKHVRETQILAMAVCVQLASKHDGRICVVEPLKIVKVLTQMAIDTDIPVVNQMELRIFHALGYRLAMVTPMEVMDHLLALLKLPQSDYRLLYGTCITVLDFFYLKRETILRELAKLFGANVVTAQMRNDYVFHGAAVVHTSRRIRSLDEPTSLLLQLFTSIHQVDIERLSQAILQTLNRTET